MFPIKDHNPSHKFPLVTILLILVNFIVFFIEITTPNLEGFISRYALIPVDINFSNFNTLYPFITSMYLHGGWFHILSNMWFLWIFGDNIEAHFGHIGFFIFYTICGLAAAFLQYIFSPNSVIPMLGASGAIAGVLGAYLVLFPRARIDTAVVSFGGFFNQVAVPASFMLIYWFAIQIFSAFYSLGGIEEGGVAFWAHAGGFAAGWILAKLIGGNKRVTYE